MRLEFVFEDKIIQLLGFTFYELYGRFSHYLEIGLTEQILWIML